jgi:hypothetical protein
MTVNLLMALMPILMLSLTAVVLMVQASIKRDQLVAWSAPNAVGCRLR